MTKDKILHWFYTAMLVIFIGTFHVIVGVSIAYNWSKKYVDSKIEKYDSIVVAPHIKETNKSIKILSNKQDTNLYINKEILKTLKEWKNQ
jgi:hypothetical protein